MALAGRGCKLTPLALADLLQDDCAPAASWAQYLCSPYLVCLRRICEWNICP